MAKNLQYFKSQKAPVLIKMRTPSPISTKGTTRWAWWRRGTPSQSVLEIERTIRAAGPAKHRWRPTIRRRSEARGSRRCLDGLVVIPLITALGLQAVQVVTAIWLSGNGLVQVPIFEPEPIGSSCTLINGGTTEDVHVSVQQFQSVYMMVAGHRVASELDPYVVGIS
jgi:hypothetical protein